MNPPIGLADDVAGVIQEVAAEVLEPCFAERCQVDAWERHPVDPLDGTANFVAARLIGRSWSP